eukprot:269300-Pelagomonas_calceolata.AAC.15
MGVAPLRGYKTAASLGAARYKVTKPKGLQSKELFHCCTCLRATSKCYVIAQAARPLQRRGGQRLHGSACSSGASLVGS